MLRALKDIIQGKRPHGVRRSSQWRAVRAEHLASYPTCAACGGTRKVEVHHKLPFHQFPQLELEPSNLVTLCESKKKGVNCHLFFGHMGDYRSFNPLVDKDAAQILRRIEQRNARKQLETAA